MGMMSGSISLGSVVGASLVWLVAGFGTVYGFAALAALAAATFLFAIARLPEPPKAPTLDPNAGKIPFATIWPFFVITTLGMTAYGMLQPILGLRLIDQFGLENAVAIGQAGAMLTGTAAAMLFSQSVLAVRLGWPPHQLLLVGGVVGVVATTVLAFTSDYWLMVAAMVLVGSSIGLLLPRQPRIHEPCDRRQGAGQGRGHQRARDGCRPRDRSDGRYRALQRLARRALLGCLPDPRSPHRPRDPCCEASGHARTAMPIPADSFRNTRILVQRTAAAASRGGLPGDNCNLRGSRRAAA